MCAAAVIALAVAPAGAATRHSYNYCRLRRVTFRARVAYVGVTAGDVLAGTPNYRDCTLGRMAAWHIGYYRYDMDWKGVETRPGVFSFRGYDSLMGELALHHIAWLPVLANPPAFRTVDPAQARHSNEWWAPRHASDFARFAAAAVRRYGPGGTFWRQYPQLPYDPIRAWQIWNEESLYFFWAPKPDPAAYTRLLKAAYAAIKRIDPHATVVTGGLPWYAVDAFAQPYYTAMFQDGALGHFDALAFHAYAPDASAAMQRVGLVRQLMNQHGAGRLPIWITEFGWASGGPPSPFTVSSPATQGSYVFEFLGDVLHRRQALGIQKVMYFDWRDLRPTKAMPDYWGDHTGMFSLRLTPKPASGSVSYYAARLDR